MSVSSHFITGSGNKAAITPCEDYAYDSKAMGVDTPQEFAVQSDGCSTGKRTDIGARILTSIYMQGLAEASHPINGGEPIFDRITDNSANYLTCRNALFNANVLNSEDMLATVGGVIHFPETMTLKKATVAHIYGDGIIAVGYKDDTPTRFIEVESGNNTPYYPVYSTDLHFNGEQAYRAEVSILETQLTHAVGHHYVKFASDGYTLFLKQEELNNVDYVIVLSDGIKTAQDSTAFTEIIPQLFESKARHTNVPRRALNKMDVQNTYNFYDDVSFAAWMNT